MAVSQIWSADEKSSHTSPLWRTVMRKPGCPARRDRQNSGKSTPRKPYADGSQTAVDALKKPGEIVKSLVCDTPKTLCRRPQNGR